MDYKDLRAWQASFQLVRKIYDLTNDFPVNEQYGITSQIRRAAVSVPSNIAEGFDRTGAKEKLHFYSIARGSLAELETQLLLTIEVGYLAGDHSILEEVVDARKLVSGLIRSTRSRV